jgi:tetratricopeptide (TPR) repeat protein
MNWVFPNPPKPAFPLPFQLIVAAVIALVGMALDAPPAIAAQDKEMTSTDRANQLAHSGHPEQAVELLQSTLAAHPSDLQARLALADIYARNSQPDKAEAEFHEALRLHPDSPSAEIALGTFYLDAGSLVSAEQVLGDAMRRHPKLTEARAQLSLVLARERKYAEAESTLRTVPPPTEKDARVRYFRLQASIHSGLGDSHAAAQAIEEAWHVMPGNEELQLVASIAEAEAGEWKACIRDVTPLYKHHPTVDSGLILLRAELASHADFKPTLHSLQALNLSESQRLDLTVRSAELLASAGQPAAAAEEFVAALKITGAADETLLYNLAVEEFDAQQSDLALATLATLRAQNDSAEVEDLIGDVNEQKGDRSAAIQSHEKAIALAPSEERYRLSLGAELLKFESYASAASVFQQAAELFPNSARIYVGLGMADYFLEKYDGSVSAFLRADKLDNGSGRPLGYLGATQMENSAGPSQPAVDTICARADSDTKQSNAVIWCGALLFRKAYLAGDRSAAPGIVVRLRRAAKLVPNDPVTNCSLGEALQWTEQSAEARHWLEICVKLRPNSAEDHYRLSRVYQELGLKQAAAEQARFTDKSNAEADPHQAITDKFANEMVGQSKTAVERQTAHPK